MLDFEQFQQFASEKIALWLPGWQLAFNRRKRALGLCHYGRKQILLSLWHLERCDWAQAEETLYHEISHALAGPAAGHGPTWQQQMNKFGFKAKITARTPYQMDQHKWALIWCNGQEAEFLAGRYRRPKTTVNWMIKGRPGTTGQVYFVDFKDWQALVDGIKTLPELDLRQS